MAGFRALSPKNKALLIEKATEIVRDNGKYILTCHYRRVQAASEEPGPPGEALGAAFAELLDAMADAVTGGDADASTHP